MKLKYFDACDILNIKRGICSNRCLSGAPLQKVEFPELACFSKLRRLLWLRQSRHFYLRLFLLSRKASNANIKLPKDISKANIPMKIETIS
nr:MAG TPA: hypothetical protein [Caudoviricetes sp.]